MHTRESRDRSFSRQTVKKSSRLQHGNATKRRQDEETAFPRHQVVGFPNQRRLEQLIVIRIAEAGLLPGVRDPSGDRFQLSQIDPF